jgi:hypothetical protein
LAAIDDGGVWGPIAQGSAGAPCGAAGAGAAVAAFGEERRPGDRLAAGLEGLAEALGEAGDGEGEGGGGVALALGPAGGGTAARRGAGSFRHAASRTTASIAGKSRPRSIATVCRTAGRAGKSQVPLDPLEGAPYIGKAMLLFG